MRVTVADGGQQGQQSTVVVMAPTAGVRQDWQYVGIAPVSTTCVNCQRQIVTHVSDKIGGCNWLCFAILCICGSVTSATSYYSWEFSYQHVIPKLL